MAWILLNTRRAELKRNINELTREKLLLTRQMRELTSFSSAVADGSVTPDEISNMSSELVYQGMNVNTTAYNYGFDHSEDTAGEYMEAFSELTQDEYFANSALMQKANLFWDPDTGELDMNKIKSDLQETYMKEYVQKYIEPELKAAEDSYEEQKIDLETQIQTMEAELQQLDGKISNEIQQDVIKLA